MTSLGWISRAAVAMMTLACHQSDRPIEPSPDHIASATVQHSDARGEDTRPAGCPDPYVARVGGADTAPVVVRRVEPAIDRASTSIEGIVIVEAIITRQGRVCSAEVLRSLSPEVDRAVLAAVRQWEFVPAKLKGQPVQAAFNLSVSIER